MAWGRIQVVSSKFHRGQRAILPSCSGVSLTPVIMIILLKARPLEAYYIIPMPQLMVSELQHKGTHSGTYSQTVRSRE